MRVIYTWRGGALEASGSIMDAHLRAWEYEPVSEDVWRPRSGEDTVRLFRTRRPDLAPAELWVGESSVRVRVEVPASQRQFRPSSRS